MLLNKFFDKALTSHRYYTLALITIFGFLLRIYNSGDGYPLWVDEAFSVWFSDQSWHYLWTEVPKFETHPVLYYSILKIWRGIFGSDEIALRSLSALVSTLVIPLTFISAKLVLKDSRKGLALLAALIAALWWPQIEHARSARPYAFTAFTMAFALPCLLYILINIERFSFAALREGKDRMISLSLMAGLGIGIAFLQWFHNLGIFYNLSIAMVLAGTWIIIGRGRLDIFLSLVAIAVLAVVVYAPNIPNILMQSKMINKDFWIQEPGIHDLGKTLISIYGLELFRALPAPPMAWMGSSFMWYNVLAIAVSLCLAMAAMFVLLKRNYMALQASVLAASFAILIFAPTLLNLLVTFTVTPVFLDRTLLATQIPLFIAFACIPFIFHNKMQKMVALLVVLVPLGWTIYNMHSEAHHSVEGERGMKDMIEIVQNKNSEGSPVFIYPNYVGFLADYYAAKSDKSFNLVSVPEPYPVVNSTKYEYPYGGAVPLSRAEDIDRLMKDQKKPKSLWLITRNQNFYDSKGIILNKISSYYLCSELHYGEKTSLQLRYFSNDPKLCAGRTAQ